MSEETHQAWEGPLEGIEKDSRKPESKVLSLRGKQPCLVFDKAGLDSSEQGLKRGDGGLVRGYHSLQ